MEKFYTVSKNKTVAQIMNSLLPNSDLNWIKPLIGENHYTTQVWPKSTPYDYTAEVRNIFKDLIDRSDRQSAWWTRDRGSWHCTEDRD